MKSLFYICLFVVYSLESFCQPIYTTDNVFIGYREDFFSSCIKETELKYVNVYNNIIDKYFYCTCVCDELIPRLSSKKIIEVIENKNLQTLFLNKKYYKMVEPCIKHYAVIEDIYSAESKNLSIDDKEIYIQMCIDDNSTSDVSNALITDQKIKEYCECLVTEFIERGYSYQQLLELKNMNSEAFNEIALPCHNVVFSYLQGNNSDVSYVPEDITGNELFSKIGLIDFKGLGYKIKISINGISNYFFFDTGATTLIINNDVEHELILNGSINDSSYKGFEYYEVANKKMVRARIIELNNVTIGDFTVSHVKAAIIEDGSLLCGNSLLNKFRKWEIDSENKYLILYK